MKRIIMSLVLITLLIASFYVVPNSINATGEFRGFLDILVWGSPSSRIGPMVINVINKHFVQTINDPEVVTSFDKLKEKLLYKGYNVICLLDTDSTAKHDIPEDIEELIKDRCKNGISGLVVSGHVIAPSSNNKIIQELVGAQHGEQKDVGRTNIVVVDVTHNVVRDVAPVFSVNLGIINDPMVYPGTTTLIAQTNEGIEVIWTNTTRYGAKAGYVELGNMAMGFGNIEISRTFCHMLYHVAGNGWLQPKEAPRNIQTKAGDSKVKITWEAPEDSSVCMAYRVFRRTADTDWKEKHDFPLQNDVFEYMDSTVENGTTYVYKVCCVDLNDDITACSHYSEVTPGKPEISISPEYPKPGETVEVIGDEYVVRGKATPGSKVVVEYTIQPIGITGKVETVADENGDFEVKIPLSPGQKVEYYVIVENELGDQVRLGPYYVKSTVAKRIINYTINSTKVYVDGYEWPQELDVPPFITENGRTMIPFRSLSEILGAKVDYSPHYVPGEPARPVEKVWYDIDSANGGHIHIDLFIGKKRAFINNVPYEMDQEPFIKGGRTVIPVRFVTEAMGAKVDWIALTKQVIITYPNPDETP